MDNFNEKTERNKRFNSLKMEHQRWVPALRDLSTYIDPTRGIFNGDRTKIGKMIDHKVLLDSHATHAKRVTASGLQTGMTDPSRPWFKLTLENVVVENIPGVREWLDETGRRMVEVMNKSNIYKVFQNCYDELVEFGTGCFLILEDYEDVIRGRSFTAGEYYLGCDNKGRVNSFGREFEMTVAQMVQEFGLESLSGSVQAMVNNNQLDNLIKIRHLIEPNDKRLPGYVDLENMPYRSCYWEASEGTTAFLAKRGYERFPVIAPRWDAITTDMVYGYGPGWHAIGDIKELQVTHKDMLIAQEKLHNPPMMVDGNVNHSNFLPGGVTKSSSVNPNTGARPAYQINPSLESFINSIDSLHRKIDRHMFADVFLMISNMDRTNITAFEVAKREQERMMMLGPILHGLNEEMHDKAIDLIFSIMADNVLIPEPPQEIAGLELKVQYISILAQAQKAIGIEQINNTVAMIGSWTPLAPDVMDNFDIDEAARLVGDMGGAPAKVLRDKSQVDVIRQARAQQQAQAMALEAANSAADTTEKLGKAAVGGEQSNMLDVIGQAVSGR